MSYCNILNKIKFKRQKGWTGRE